jgi:ATP-dependent DNA helicase RecG
MGIINPANLKESEAVELKEQFNDSALKTLGAFVNTKGGSLFVGVKNDSTLLSGGISDQAQQDVVSKTMQVLGINPVVTLHEHDGNDFLEVKVRPRRPPVSVRGKYYQRVGNTTREVTGEALRRLFLEGESWDAVTDERYSLENIDSDEVMNFAQAARREGRIAADMEQGNMQQILERLNLIMQGRLTNGAILLFGKEPQRYFHNAVVKIGRFRDETTIVADRTVTGNLFRQARETEEQIKSLIGRRYEIPDDSFQRRDVWQYPLPAIREALLNALIHRSYFKMNVKIQIKIFDNSLRIFNPGKLPNGLEIEDLKKPHSSYPRNELLADTFYRAGLIEEWGSGIQRIIGALNEEKLPEPEFEEQGNGFIIRFIDKELSKVPLDIPESLNDRQQAALDYLTKHESIDNSIYRELFDITKRTATRDLSDLAKRGLIKQIGKTGTGTHYKLVKSII